MLLSRSRSRSCSASTRYSGTNLRAISARPSQCDDPHRPSSRRSTCRLLRFLELESRIFLRQPLPHLLNTDYWVCPSFMKRTPQRLLPSPEDQPPPMLPPRF